MRRTQVHFCLWAELDATKWIGLTLGQCCEKFIHNKEYPIETIRIFVWTTEVTSEHILAEGDIVEFFHQKATSYLETRLKELLSRIV